MATAKKSAKKAAATKKPAKKSVKKTAKKAAAVKRPAPKPKKRSKAPVASLTDDEKRAMLHPPSEYATLTTRAIGAWSAHTKELRVSGSSPAKLRSLLSAAQRAAKREEDLRLAMERKLGPLSDARLKAQDAVWRATLDLFAIAKAQGRVLPQLLEEFAFLSELYKNSGRKDPEPTPTE